MKLPCNVSLGRAVSTTDKFFNISNLEKYSPVEETASKSETIGASERYKWTKPPKLVALADYCQVAFIAYRDNEKLRTSN